MCELKTALKKEPETGSGFLATRQVADMAGKNGRQPMYLGESQTQTLHIKVWEASHFQNGLLHGGRGVWASAVPWA